MGRLSAFLVLCPEESKKGSDGTGILEWAEVKRTIEQIR